MGYRYLKHTDEVDVDLFIVCDSSCQASSRNLMPYFVGHHERSAPLVMMMMVMVKIRIIILMILMVQMPFLYKLPKKVFHGLTCSFYGANNALFVLRLPGEQWQLAMHLLSLMPMRRLLADEVSFNSVISVCEQCCQWQIALDVFSTMMTSMLLPNLITFNSTISACSKASQPSKGLALIHAMREQHLRADIISYNSIITADIEQMNGWQRSCQMLDDLTPGNHRKLKMWMSLAPQETDCYR